MNKPTQNQIDKLVAQMLVHLSPDCIATFGLICQDVLVKDDVETLAATFYTMFQQINKTIEEIKES
jgi:HAMP domain-containing protein